jgi:hypothetical protein
MGTRRNAVDRMTSIVIGTSITQNLDEAFGPVDWREIREGMDLDAAITDLRKAEAATRRLRLRLQALREGQSLPMCEYCGNEIAGRKGARFCSASCRTLHNRLEKRSS